MIFYVIEDGEILDSVEVEVTNNEISESGWKIVFEAFSEHFGVSEDDLKQTAEEDECEYKKEDLIQISGEEIMIMVDECSYLCNMNYDYD